MLFKKEQVDRQLTTGLMQTLCVLKLIGNGLFSMNSWKVQGLPTTYIINPEGIISYRAIRGREFDHPDIQKKVFALTKQHDHK